MSKRRKKNNNGAEPRVRTSRLEMVAAEAVQNHGHLATTDIVRRRDVLSSQLENLDAELFELMTRTAEARGKRAKVEATLAGIMQVLLGRP